MTGTASDRLPSALRFGDAALGCFAVWTVCANTVVFFGLGLDALLALFGVVGASAWFGLRRLPPDAPAACEACAAAERSDPPDVRFGALALIGTAAALVALHATRDLRVFWLIALVVSSASCWRAFRAAPGAGPSPESARPALGDARWLWMLAAAGALLASVLHRPDADDALYLNLAVAAATRPELPLLAADTLHGIEGLPLTLPVYVLHSVELLWAALARASGLRVLDVAHVVTPALAGALVPLALARLLRLLLPREWPWALACALAFLLLAGGAVHSFGSFGFVRLQQGKAIALSVAVPLIAAHAIELARAPGARRFARLAGSQIAALGLTASAVWLAPAVAGLALLAALPATSGVRSALERIALGVLASAWPLLAGLAVRGSTRARVAEGMARGELPVLDAAGFARSAIEPVLGGEPLASLLLAALLLAGAFAATPACRRFASVFALGFLVVFWNPFSASTIASSVTGPGTYWRVFWVLPLPVLVAALATAPRTKRAQRVPAAALGTLACVLLLLWLPSAPVASAAHGVVWSRPGWRIPSPARPALAALLEHAGPGTAVLLPLELAPWLAGFEGAPSPLVVRPDYLGVLRTRYPTSELDRRMHLARLVSGDLVSPRTADALRKATADYALEAVGLAGSARAITLRDALTSAGFEPVFDDVAYELWARTGHARSIRSNQSDQSK